MKFKHGNGLFFGTIVTLALAACGGGGSPSVPPPVAIAPSPTATVTLSTVKAKAGDNVVVTWSSTDATSCVGSDALSTSATSGISAVNAAVGQTKFTLTCTGSGGSKVATAMLVVPIPVLKSSYENKITAGDQTHGTGLPLSSLATAYADFFQDGSYSMVLSSEDYDPSKPATMNQNGRILFYKKDTSDKWIDHTSEIIKDATGCVHPRKALIADFNGDGKPDVYFACHGFDAPPFPGEKPHLLLSQADGIYQNITLPITCYCHGATAADLNGDGKADLIITDTSIAQIPYALINNGDGTSFTPDFNRIPAELKGKGGIYSLELIDTGTGKYDLFVGSGTPPGSDPKNPDANWALPNGILKNDGKGSFLQTPLVALPNQAGSTGIVYGLALDFVVMNGYVYYQQINNDWDANNPSYSDILVRKVKLSDMSSTILYEHFGQYNNHTTWFPWLASDGAATLKAQCNIYVYAQSTLPGSSCGVSIAQ